MVSKKITKLTEEQKKIIPGYVKKWRDRLTVQTTDEHIKQMVRLLYVDICELEEPEVIIADCPFTAQIIANLMTDKSVQESVWGSVEESVWKSVRNSVWESVEESVWNSVRNSVDKIIKKSFEWSIYGNISDYAWTAFYQFWEDIGIEIQIPKWDIWKKIMDGGIYDMLQFEKLVIVVHNPVEVDFDDDGNVKDGVSVLFKSGLRFLYLDNKIQSQEMLNYYELHGGSFDKLRAMKRMFSQELE